MVQPTAHSQSNGMRLAPAARDASEPTEAATDHPSAANTPHTLGELVNRLASLEAAHHSDLVLGLKKLRMTPEGMLDVPGRGRLVMNDWSQGQLGALIGLAWRKWLSGADLETVAPEVNQRLARSTEEVRVRSTAAPDCDGAVRALVSPGYCYIPDSLVAAIAAEALAEFGEARVLRLEVTERATFFALAVGKPMKPVPGSRVGDLAAGLTVRNSAVGFCSLAIRLSLQRLACLNGLVIASDASATRSHRGLDVARVRGMVLKLLDGFSERMREASELLERATGRVLALPPEDEIARVIDRARMPKRLVTLVADAYAKEPDATAFGISQALTLAAQSLPPEERFELEALAGSYLVETV